MTVDKGAPTCRAARDQRAAQRPIRIRQTKYSMRNVLAQARLAIKRRARPMLGFKYFHCARILLAGIGSCTYCARSNAGPRREAPLPQRNGFTRSRNDFR
ncbi:hypothetical protein ACU4GD_29750 [Cupriavidus basilensis]